MKIIVTAILILLTAAAMSAQEPADTAMTSDLQEIVIEAPG